MLLCGTSHVSTARPGSGDTDFSRICSPALRDTSMSLSNVFTFGVLRSVSGVSERNVRLPGVDWKVTRGTLELQFVMAGRERHPVTLKNQVRKNSRAKVASISRKDWDKEAPQR